jgi:hypothetical protein
VNPRRVVSLRSLAISFAQRQRGGSRTTAPWRSSHTRLNKRSASLRRCQELGPRYPQARIAGLRRLYLRRTSSHLYYTFTQDAVTIRAFWHAKRGHGPFLQS